MPWISRISQLTFLQQADDFLGQRRSMDRPWRGSQFWLEAQNQWQRLKQSVPHDRRFEVRFEDLIADAEKTVAAICDFLEVDFEEDTLCMEQDTTCQRPSPES